MSVQSTFLFDSPNRWGQGTSISRRPRGSRPLPSRSKAASVTFVGILMGGIIINATLLQTGHVPTAASIHEADQAVARQAPVQLAASIPPTVELPTLALAKPEAVDPTPTGAIASPARPSPAKAPVRALIAKAPPRHKIDGITAFLRRLGSIASR